jgi:hypothetical protein
MYDCLQGFPHHGRPSTRQRRIDDLKQSSFQESPAFPLRVRLSVCGNLHLLHAKPISSCGIGQRQLRR